MSSFFTTVYSTMVVQLLRAALLRPAILVVFAGRVHSFNFGVNAPWRQLRQEHQPYYLINNQHHQHQVQLASTSVGHEEDVAVLQTTATTFVSGIDEDEGDDYSDNENSDSGDVDSPGSRCQILLEALIKSTTSALTGLTKKKTSLENELSKAQSLEATMNRANLIVSNLYKLPPGTVEAEVEDWENDGIIVKLVLNTKEYGTFQEESDALFAAARKMKRGSAVVEELLAQTTDAEEILNDSLMDLQSMENSEQLDEGTMVLIQERLERTSKTTGWKPPKNYMQDDSGVRSKPRKNTTSQKSNKSKPNPREFTSPSGHKVLVGRNRRDNESICFQLSKPTDIWMHARGCPGAHVLLCCRRGSPEITDVDLQFAADLAAFYSDARTETKTDVTTASPKDITKPRGAPLGAVTLRQEGKTLLGRPDDVAQELKEAREQSGANWSELGYRKLGGRAKNKKKTAAVEKETAKKRRQEARESNKRRQRKEELNDWF